MAEIPDELANSVLDSLYELRGERFWWKDEPRCGYQSQYRQLCEDIEKLEKILGRNQVKIGPQP